MYFTKNIIIYWYTALLILVALAWYHYGPTRRDITFSEKDIDEATSRALQLAKYNLFISTANPKDANAQKVQQQLSQLLSNDAQPSEIT